MRFTESATSPRIEIFRRRIARSTLTVLVLTLFQVIGGPVLLPQQSTSKSSAATLANNLTNFVQWNTWMGGANHRPYINRTTTPVSSDGDEVKLTSREQYAVAGDQFSSYGYLWNTTVWTGDFSVSAEYWFGNNNDGADGLAFVMRPLSTWPSGGNLGSSGGSHAAWGTANTITAIFDTYQNPGEIAEDHLTVLSRNSANVETSYTGSGQILKDSTGANDTDIEDGTWKQFTITWTMATKNLKISSGTLGGTQYEIKNYNMSGQSAESYTWGWLGFTGGATSDFVVKNINFNAPPTITLQPTPVTTTIGSQVTFNATYTSVDSGVSLQWSSSTDGATWSNISGATSSSYTFDAARDLTQRRYRLGVTNTAANQSYTTFSNSALLTVNPPLLGFETDTALLFNGTSQFAQVADSNEVEFPAAFSVSAWIYPTGAMGDYMILAKNNSIQFYIQNGIYGFSAMADAAWNRVPTGVSALVNQWQHVAYTRLANETDFRFYLNGTLAYTGDADTLISNGAPVNNTSPLTIGGRSTTNGSATSLFTGQIDHLSVFGLARAGEDIRTEMNTYTPPDTANLLLSYDFNEGSGLTLFNRRNVGPSNTDLTLYGSPTFSDVKIASTYGPYSVLQFPRSYITSEGGWKVPSNVTRINYLVVAGGGAGGGSMYESHYSGGGGGGGGVRSGTTNTIPVRLNIKVGTGQISTGCVLGRGGSSTVSGSGLVAIDATGGGSGSCNNSTGDGSGGINGNTGGSGGGGGATYYSMPAGTGNLGGYTPAEGFSGGGGQLNSTSSDFQSAGGGGGAGQAGVAGTSAAAGNGGAGLLSTILDGTNKYYGGGGGGGVRTTPTVGAGGLGGGGTGGATLTRQGTGGEAGTGGGGGGNSKPLGNNGGSGVVIIRWITALKPTYTKPSNAYLNVGMTETFTTNVAQDSATAVLTRTFRWESTTPTANGAYTLIKQGTGAANAVFSWVPTDISTSGSGYLYRLTVTDSDTAGLFITDSSTAFAVINRALVVSGNSVIPKAINLSKSETFTITLGTSTYRSTLSPIIPGITLDTSTAGSPVIRISDTMTVGTYYETLTVTDSVSASVVLPLVINVVPPPILTNTGEVVWDGQVFNLDPSSSASYNPSTTALSDLSGSKKPITKFGSTTYSDDFSGSLELKSTSSDYLKYTEVAPLNQWTIETYVKVNSIPGDLYIISTHYNSAVPANWNVNYLLAVKASGSNVKVFAGFIKAGVWKTHETIATFTTGTWTHLAATYDGSGTVSIYFDGVFKGSTTGLGSWGVPFNASQPDVFINKRSDDANYGNINYGFLRVYNRNLSQSEIIQNFNSTKTRFDSSNLSQIKPTNKYGTVVLESFTVTSGFEAMTVALTVGDRAGIDWDTTTASNQVRLLIQESLTVGTYNETITVTDSLGQSTYLPIRMTVTKADSLTVSMDTATSVSYNGSPITIYPRTTVKGFKSSDTATSAVRFSSSLYTESIVVPTSADTYTVRGAEPVFTIGSLSNYEGVIYETRTAVVRKINQRPLNIFKYGGSVGSGFIIQLQGGDGTGAVTETLTGVSTLTGCAISNRILTAAEQKQGFCEVRVVKAGDQNYFAETETAQLYFMAYISNQPSGQVGSGATIGLNGRTSLETSTVQAPSITGLSTLTLSLGAGGNFTITGTGFTGSVTIKFWRNKSISVTSGDGTTIVIPVSSIASAGATSGRIAVITAAGEGVSVNSLTISP